MDEATLARFAELAVDFGDRDIFIGKLTGGSTALRMSGDRDRTDIATDRKAVPDQAQDQRRDMAEIERGHVLLRHCFGNQRRIADIRRPTAGGHFLDLGQVHIKQQPVAAQLDGDIGLARELQVAERGEQLFFDPRGRGAGIGLRGAPQHHGLDMRLVAGIGIALRLGRTRPCHAHRGGDVVV